jgi:hypothetical protein
MLNARPQVRRQHEAEAQLGSRTNRTGLPGPLKAGLEALSGLPLDDVRVHRNSSLPAQLHAHAFARGKDIHLAPGQDRHLPHEAWHVVQQKEGRVRATTQLRAGIEGNDETGLELEAEAMGARALRLGQAAFGVAASPRPAASFAAGAPVQRVILRGKPPPIQNYLPFFNDEAVKEALILAAKQRGLPEEACKLAFLEGHKNSLVHYTVDEALTAAMQALQQKAPQQHSSQQQGFQQPLAQSAPPQQANQQQAPQQVALQQQAPPAMELQPHSRFLLHEKLPGQLDNYRAWLFDEVTWSGRPKKILDELPKARALFLKAAETLAHAQRFFPLLQTSQRQAVLLAEKTDGSKIEAEIGKIRDMLAMIDTMVREPPVPPKTWASFMGDDKVYNYADGAGTSIPITFYKSMDNYLPIVVPQNNADAIPGSYAFPNGPRVRGRKGWHNLIVNGANHYKIGTVLINDKENDDRATQIDINFALTNAGVNMNGKDGDHVRDLGFGGKDKADNYWPLQASINRRPFLGWRSNYGVNYLSGGNLPRTASITALAGKKTVIEALMAPGEGNVPVIGVKPEPNSGAVSKK